MNIEERLDRTVVTCDVGIETDEVAVILAAMRNLEEFWRWQGRREGYDEGYMSRVEEEEDR